MSTHSTSVPLAFSNVNTDVTAPGQNTRDILDENSRLRASLLKRGSESGQGGSGGSLIDALAGALAIGGVATAIAGKGSDKAVTLGRLLTGASLPLIDISRNRRGARAASLAQKNRNDDLDLLKAQELAARDQLSDQKSSFFGEFGDNATTRAVVAAGPAAVSAFAQKERTRKEQILLRFLSDPERLQDAPPAATPSIETLPIVDLDPQGFSVDQGFRVDPGVVAHAAEEGARPVAAAQQFFDDSVEADEARQSSSEVQFLHDEDTNSIEWRRRALLINGMSLDDVDAITDAEMAKVSREPFTQFKGTEAGRAMFLQDHPSPVQQPSAEAVASVDALPLPAQTGQTPISREEFDSMGIVEQEAYLARRAAAQPSESIAPGASFYTNIAAATYAAETSGAGQGINLSGIQANTAIKLGVSVETLDPWAKVFVRNVLSGIYTDNRRANQLRPPEERMTDKQVLIKSGSETIDQVGAGQSSTVWGVVKSLPTFTDTTLLSGPGLPFVDPSRGMTPDQVATLHELESLEKIDTANIIDTNRAKAEAGYGVPLTPKERGELRGVGSIVKEVVGVLWAGHLLENRTLSDSISTKVQEWKIGLFQEDNPTHAAIRHVISHKAQVNKLIKAMTKGGMGTVSDLDAIQNALTVPSPSSSFAEFTQKTNRLLGEVLESYNAILGPGRTDQHLTYDNVVSLLPRYLDPYRGHEIVQALFIEGVGSPTHEGGGSEPPGSVGLLDPRGESGDVKRFLAEQELPKKLTTKPPLTALERRLQNSIDALDN